MKEISKYWMSILIFLFVFIFDGKLWAQQVNPQQQAIAQKAAETIVNALGTQKYSLLWSQYTSQWFKSKVDENVFLANLSMGRAQFGQIQKISLVSFEHATSDPVNAFQGDIYAFTFRDKYPIGEFYERIVVIKDTDGQFRMSGLFGSAVPTQ